MLPGEPRPFGWQPYYTADSNGRFVALARHYSSRNSGKNTAVCDDQTLAWCTVGVTAGEVDARIIALKGSPTSAAIQLVPRTSKVSTWRSFVTYNLKVDTAGKYILGFVGSSYNGGSDSVYLTVHGVGGAQASGPDHIDFYMSGIAQNVWNYDKTGYPEATGFTVPQVDMVWWLSTGYFYIKAYGREKEAALERIVVQPYGNQAAKPAELSESPRTHPCVTGRNRGECQYAAWRTPWGAWGACSNKCGSGTQSRSRTVTCVREDDQTVPARECTQKGITMPASTESQTCSDQSGCSYRWSPGAWGSYGRCSSTCGSGTQSRSRTVRCERSDGVGVADSFCSGQAKPEEMESKACTDTSTCTYEWRTGLYGRWSDCSNDCGSGTQERTRPVTCTRSDRTAVSDSECRERKPESSERRICDSTRGCTFEWETGNWQRGQCSNQCGDGEEEQTRTVICRRSDGKEVEDRSCPSPKPDTRRVVPCRDESNCSYSYVADPWGPWGKCSIDCGYGTQTRTRTVRCVDGDGNQVPTRMCEQMKPRPPKPTDKEGKRCTGPRCRYTSSCRYRAGRGRSYCERYFDNGGPCNYVNYYTCRS